MMSSIYPCARQCIKARAGGGWERGVGRGGSSGDLPDGGLQFEELFRCLDDPHVVTGQDAGPKEEAHVPVALQFVQAALLAQ